MKNQLSPADPRPRQHRHPQAFDVDGTLESIAKSGEKAVLDRRPDRYGHGKGGEHHQSGNNSARRHRPPAQRHGVNSRKFRAEHRTLLNRARAGCVITGLAERVVLKHLLDVNLGGAAGAKGAAPAPIVAMIAACDIAASSL